MPQFQGVYSRAIMPLVIEEAKKVILEQERAVWPDALVEDIWTERGVYIKVTSAHHVTKMYDPFLYVSQEQEEEYNQEYADVLSGKVGIQIGIERW